MDTPRAILFDLDDTILDTTRSATRVWQLTAEAFATEIGQPPAVFNPILDESRRWYWADADRNRAGRLDVQQSRIDVTLHGLQRLGLDDPDLARRFADHYSEHRVASMRPFDGAFEALQHFKDEGVKMALLTNGDTKAQRDKVRHFGLDRYFEAVLIEGEVGYGKPDPRLFEAALEACDAPAAASWCVGDHLEWEVLAPQRLGLTGIWVDWDHQGLPDDAAATPDRIIHHIAELAGLDVP